MIKDLKKQKKNRKTMGQLTVWFRRYADKISDLPPRNVDGEALDFGMSAATTLRGGATSVTQAAARSRVREQEVPDQYNVQTSSRTVGVVGGGWYGGGGAYTWNGWRATPDVTRTQKMKTHVRTQERLQGTSDAQQALDSVDDQLQSVRYRMTEKYDADF